MSGVACGEEHVEALTLAMVLAPGVYVRNRMFDLFTKPFVQRARGRAATLRGIVRHLPRATAPSVTAEARGEATVYVLRYFIAPLALSRVVELTKAELAGLRVAAGRAAVTALPVEEGDRSVVDEALARLLSFDAAGLAEARSALAP